MRLFVQIPCYNEEATLSATIAEIPREMPGVDEVRVLVVDDGSSDRTARVAAEAGADFVVRHTQNLGLARAFATGLDACLRLGADIIVNTDADGQYPGVAIPELVAPILNGSADIVLGDRNPGNLAHFSVVKRRLQRLGSLTVRKLSSVNVKDAVTGFRALSREAALKMNIVSSFSYTIEMLIQAGRKGLAVTSVPVAARETGRRSRLARTTMEFIERSLTTMVRVYAMYHPLRFFGSIGLLLAVGGTVPIVRFLYYFAIGEGGGHIQSLVLGGAILTIGFVTVLIGLLADLVGFNRQLIEMLLEIARRESTVAAPSSIQTDADRTGDARGD